jgi:hypothetical protein
MKATRRPQVLARSARLLVGLLFLLAAVHKAALSPDFVDGRFFRRALLVDARFESLTHLLGVDAETLAANRALVEADPHLATPAGAVVETPALRAAARVLTWAALAMEGAVALSFLAPLRGAWVRLRDVALLVFCATNYPVAPVESFDG